MLVATTPLSQVLGTDPKVVVLDTFVLRELMHAQKGAEPSWYQTFVDAKSSGFSFSISPYALLELANQLKDHRITQSEFLAGVGLANKFIEARLPVCPDWKVVLFLAGLSPTCADTVHEVAAKSKDLWDMLVDPTRHSQLTAAPINTELEETRKRHRATIGTVKTDLSGATIDFETVSDAILAILGSKLNLSERDSQRLRVIADLSAHFAEASLKGTTPYNEASNRSRNDGIDRWLPFVLMLPAFLITEAKWMNIARAKSPQPWSDLVLTTAEFKRLCDAHLLPDMSTCV
jgi:hypothetical protein